MSDIAWIALDWGTTHLRGWGLDDRNRIVRQAFSDKGMGTLQPAEYPNALADLTADWQADHVPVLACGMVGSRQGWYEAPYRKIPCTALSVDQLVDIPDMPRAIRIVPGLCQTTPADVMRGEETQIAGLLSTLPDQTAHICLPGSHSKWVQVVAGNITHFKTYMTGELFAALSQNTVLKHSVATDEWCQDSFLSAVQEIWDQPHRLSVSLFGIRAQALLADLSAGQARARLSGLLIGAEIAFLKQEECQHIHLVGAAEIATYYRLALEVQNIAVTCHQADDLTLAGLQSLYQEIKS